MILVASPYPKFYAGKSLSSYTYCVRGRTTITITMALSSSSISAFYQYGCFSSSSVVLLGGNGRFNFNVKVSSDEDDDGDCLQTDDEGLTPSTSTSTSTIVVDEDENNPPNTIIKNGILLAGAGKGGGGREANSAIIYACLIGLLTGSSVVLFNYVVHELRDLFWDGVLYRGASWLREQPLEETWGRTILVPVFGGVLVSLLNNLGDSLDIDAPKLMAQIKAVLKQFLRSLAASITLGTGNSLGPEGPSVEIGASIANGVASLSPSTSAIKLPLVASGSAAGIASGWNSFNYADFPTTGFNAAVAGCFFAVESVLWPSPDSAVSLTSTTSMVILSAVIASVLSEVGLGAQPAFKVPSYDFRSASELPLYLLLGFLCGMVSLALTRCTTFMIHEAEEIKKAGRAPKAVLPVTGGFAVGLMALAYPEILYWGFQNVDILLESRPFVVGLSANLLVQLVGVKIIATSICRASGLVGGYYAPSLFIGAATGMAYGKFIALAVSESHPVFPSSFIEVASPQAYGLVGMAATLAGVCQVPLTSVLLLFELTQDYRILLPLLAAVGMSSWITSSRIRRTELEDVKKVGESALKIQQSDASNKITSSLFSGYSYSVEASNIDNSCDVESSSCFEDSDAKIEEVERRVLVSQAMKTSFATVLRSTSLVEAVTLMLAEKLSYVLIVNKDNHLIGILSLEDILEFRISAPAKRRKPEEILVADMCSFDGEKGEVLRIATPGMDLLSAKAIMIRHGLSQLPVVSDLEEGCRRKPVGVLDMQSIKLICRAVAAKEYLTENFTEERD